MKREIESGQFASGRRGTRKLCSLLFSLVAAGLCTALGTTTNVTVVGFAFSPKVVTIQPGDTVIWTGLSTIHTVASDSQALCGVAPVPGGSCTNTFNTPGAYAYHCVAHAALFSMTGLVQVAAVAAPPMVTITNPLANSVFATPAAVQVIATADSPAGTVTNIQFFSNGNLLGSVAAPPFQFTTPPLSAGSYSLTAKAIATTGLSATSAPVNFSVVTAVTVSNYAPRLLNGQLVFNHTANPGLRYAVENSTNFINWSPLVTNTAVSNSVEVTDSFRVGALHFYRVGRLPNP